MGQRRKVLWQSWTKLAPSQPVFLAEGWSFFSLISDTGNLLGSSRLIPFLRVLGWETSIYHAFSLDEVTSTLHKRAQSQLRTNNQLLILSNVVLGILCGQAGRLKECADMIQTSTNGSKRGIVFH